MIGRGATSSTPTTGRQRRAGAKPWDDARHGRGWSPCGSRPPSTRDPRRVGIIERVQRYGLTVRAGVHTGEAEIVGDDLRGITVHIGSRLASQAGESELLVSSTVKDLVVGSASNSLIVARTSSRGTEPVASIRGHDSVTGCTQMEPQNGLSAICAEGEATRH